MTDLITAPWIGHPDPSIESCDYARCDHCDMSRPEDEMRLTSAGWVCLDDPDCLIHALDQLERRTSLLVRESAVA